MDKQITIIIPTYNREEILFKTIQSYLNQAYVTEIIVVDDGSSEASSTKLVALLSHLPIRIIKNQIKKGAYQSKIIGARNAQTPLIFFGEDDAFIAKDYIKNIVDFYVLNSISGVVSGSIVYMNPGDDYQTIEPQQYLREGKLFDYNLIKFNPFCKIIKNELVPFTHALFVTRREYFINHMADNIYSKGNGYREETDFQMSLYLKGYHNYILTDVYCFHLSVKDVPLGGQRLNRFKKFFWTVALNNYFISKHYREYQEKNKLRQSMLMAKFYFFNDQLNQMFIKPILNKIL